MRELDLLQGYPQPSVPRRVGPHLRTIKNRITASYRGKDFYDGDRRDGYGGLNYDGRWIPIARNMLREYHLDPSCSVLQIGCDKGFLLHDLLEVCPGLTVRGTEISDYAIANSMPSVKSLILKAPFETLPFPNRHFHLVIAIGPVYSLNLPDAISCLKEIQRVGRGNSFVTLGAFDNEEDFRLFRYWTLLGSTILSKTDWLEVLEHTGYTGDYKFNDAKSLELIPEHSDGS